MMKKLNVRSCLATFGASVISVVSAAAPVASDLPSLAVPTTLKCIYKHRESNFESLLDIDPQGKSMVYSVTAPSGYAAYDSTASSTGNQQSLEVTRMQHGLRITVTNVTLGYPDVIGTNSLVPTFVRSDKFSVSLRKVSPTVGSFSLEDVEVNGARIPLRAPSHSHSIPCTMLTGTR